MHATCRSWSASPRWPPGPAIDEIRAAQAVTGDRLAAVMVQANSARPDVVIAHLDAIHQATGAKVVLQDYPLASGVSISTAALISVVAGLRASSSRSRPRRRPPAWRSRS